LTYLCIGPFFLASLSGIRQYLAIAFFCYLLAKLKEGVSVKLLLQTVIVAFMAHLSILLIVPLFFVLNKEISHKIKMIICVLAVIGSKVLGFILGLTPYARYLTVDSDDMAINLTVFIFMPISLLCILMEGKLKNKENNIFFNMNFISFLCMLLMFLNRDIIADVFLRLNNYFFTGMIILIPFILLKFKMKTVKIVLCCIYITFLMGYYMRNTILNGELNNLTPYFTNYSLFN
jgi:hypothetical protein